MLLFDKVSKKYDGGIIALEDVGFKVDQGEFFFLVGPSGAGKTTLMRLLIREEIPTSGSIFFKEIDVPNIPTKLLPTYRQRLGIVFQDIKLLSTKTLEENINFALDILGKEDKEIKETTDYLLETVGLQDRRNLFPHQLSGGEQQRGAIARALANNPELFIADEPTGNLDPDNAMQVLEILKKINKGGTTVMIISHDRGIVNEMKTRVVRIDQGKVISDNKGDYDTVKTPKKTSAEETKDKENKKEEENVKFKGLDIGINEIFDKAKISDIDMILNLTNSDLNNLKLNKSQQDELEKYVANYLNKEKHE
ncbi:MAG: Cell division ATP-binding protein FtsE [candidate division WS6 bacterium GW2011_GWC1_36_11]|uniref:Cell division ATP-binding protein FtsE n=3 Tax=Candidatus Dojkabacteria TaxID=74243 RepID=A0A0G0D751_9BACT|nr:MAG: Cell division ATP-binding protein FtsE [candidate division WS6 bacterium GW2011_GWC1_36_11]KKQ04150.1 MAG: Cell division ATP-binding protein FtsE [candidate division WS6 bacterium GW2011_WS6_36_26]KKQ12135.1 MAG: Cell division ATP-binding protein FtsE [candidate division WS6 bacterium GW2011_GWC2_36_7]KKQ12315.1 MAG: Cell division ATP-binding protein FtsE [Candidatus Nomurabacteria bacterium GW2011_GWE1_36_71]KKQ16897.1 MAG: Cell division ATP-binding protein FtsE [candidate division WS6